LALSWFAGLALIQAGCQSWPCGDCNGWNPVGFVRRATNRVLHRENGCCGPGAVGGGAVEYGAPSGVVVPPPSAPLYAPAPSSGAGASTVPVVPDRPTDLDSIPSARPAPLPNGSSSTSGSGARSTSYYTRQSSMRTAVRLKSGGSTEDSKGAARASSRNASPDEDARDDDNPLDHLPPLGLPGEVTNSETTPPAPSALKPEGNPGQHPPSQSSTGSGPADEADDASLTLTTSMNAAPEVDATPGAATGIARFASVDLKLAGGSMPSAAGVSWLVEKGYRTVLDLRDSAEVSPAFIADASGRGLRYVALPINLKTLDPDRLARFQFELAAPEARPLFFFDSDGSRAGALWYIRRVTLDHVDAQLARHEAEDIGLKDEAMWKAATAYVQRLEAAKAHPAPARSAATDPPAASVPADRPHSPEPFATRTAKTRSVGRQSPAPDPFSSPEPLNWRPFAAILLTGLSLPLAYLTRTAVPAAIARARASLPAPAPRRQSLPRASGD
jgi:hypothetical protein